MTVNKYVNQFCWIRQIRYYWNYPDLPNLSDLDFDCSSLSTVSSTPVQKVSKANHTSRFQWRQFIGLRMTFKMDLTTQKIIIFNKNIY